MTSPGCYGPIERQLVGQPVSLFALTYGMEAIVLTEIGMPTFRTDFPEQSNAKTMVKDLDTADELREAVAIQIA